MPPYFGPHKLIFFECLPNSPNLDLVCSSDILFVLLFAFTNFGLSEVL